MIAKIRRISLTQVNLQSLCRLATIAGDKFCNHFRDPEAKPGTRFAIKIQPVLIYWIARLFPSEAAIWLMARLRLIQLGGKHNG